MSLRRILREKEERSQIQKEMNKRWNSALVSFSLNIPGAKKNGPYSKILFNVGKEILQNLPFEKYEHQQIALQIFICVKEEAKVLKDFLVKIEETHPLGRFFDFDVFDSNLKKISRQTARQCFLCTNNAFNCSRTKAHSQERLKRFVEKKTKDFFCRKIAIDAYEALTAEVDCTPKPGLVDKNNNGSHKDMFHSLFVKSATCLQPFAYECVERGFTFKGKNPNSFFCTLRNLGKTAEKKMLQTTGGINTHKGAIFSLGLSAAALGFLLSKGKDLNEINLSKLIKKMCGQTLRKELLKSKGKTAGERIFKKLKIAGIRKEASLGYPFSLFKALPYYRQEKKTSSKDEAEVKTFLFLLTHTEDTNIINRGGLTALKEAQTKARALLESPPFSLHEVFKMDQEFIGKNLSPGGTADLLALVFFLDKNIKN